MDGHDFLAYFPFQGGKVRLWDHCTVCVSLLSASETSYTELSMYVMILGTTVTSSYISISYSWQ